MGDYEREKFEKYPEQGTLEATVAFFDQYVEFSQKRNAPVFCGEFGAFAPFMTNEQRVQWYEIVTDLLEEKGISRTSWDYFGPFGVYDINWKELREKKMFPELKFPENLNKDICKALHLNYEF